MVIAGATASTFTLTQAQVGKVMSVTASYTDGYGKAESVSSGNTGTVANVNDAPTGTVSIVGTATQGQVLTVGNTLVDSDGLGAISYQWKAADVAIGGATASTFTLTQAQVGKVMSVTASYTDGFGKAESLSSTPTATVVVLNATMTTNVSSLSTFDTVAAALNKSFNLGSAASWVQAAYDSTYWNSYYNSVTRNQLTSTVVSGTINNAGHDPFTLRGSNLLSFPNTITHEDYTFNSYGIHVSMDGSVQTASNYTQSGYMTQASVSSDSTGSITMFGNVNVLTKSIAINSVTWSVDGVTMTATGSIQATVTVGSDNYYHTALTGTYNQMTMTYSGNTIQMSNLSLNPNTIYSSAPDFFSQALLGNDQINGTSGNDILFGYGGNDVMTGNGGNDLFVFTTQANSATNFDTITDFSSGDTLIFRTSVYSGLGSAGALNANQFASGVGLVAATTTDDRFFYNTSTGILSYDADGSASGSSAVQVVLIGVSSHPALTATDFLVVS